MLCTSILVSTAVFAGEPVASRSSENLRAEVEQQMRDRCFDIHTEFLAALFVHKPQGDYSAAIRASVAKLKALEDWGSYIAPRIRETCSCFLKPTIASLATIDTPSALLTKKREVESFLNSAPFSSTDSVARARYACCSNILEHALDPAMARASAGNRVLQ